MQLINISVSCRRHIFNTLPLNTKHEKFISFNSGNICFHTHRIRINMKFSFLILSVFKCTCKYPIYFELVKDERHLRPKESSQCRDEGHLITLRLAAEKNYFNATVWLDRYCKINSSQGLQHKNCVFCCMMATRDQLGDKPVTD
jgi:hypothetical protein